MLSPLPELPVYHLHPLTFVRGQGAYVYDQDGREYLDMYGGHAVAVSGHCHPRVVAAIIEQAAGLLFYSNLVQVPHRHELCVKLMELTVPAFAAVFLTNSGAEANEAALTIARLATKRRRIAAVAGGFHGRSLLTLSLSGLERYRALTEVGGQPLFPYVTILPCEDLTAAQQTLDESFAAVIVEPVQGLAGAVPLSAEYLAGLRAQCDRVGALLIFDEVQCGMGRTGTFLAGAQSGVQPDLATLAKGLGAGFPIGATLVAERLLEAVRPGDLGTTFGGGPVACAAALTNLAVLQDEDLSRQARETGDYLARHLAGQRSVLRVQGRGLLLGLVLNRPAAPVAARLLNEQAIVVGTSAVPEVMRLMPPLTLRRDQADRFLNALSAVLELE